MSEHKTKIIKFRVTEAEYIEIDCKLGGQITMSDFCRKALAGTKIVRLDSPEIQDMVIFNRKLIGQVGYIGNNINQIAHRLNSENLKGSITEIQVIEATEELAEIRNMLLHLIAIASGEINKIKNKYSEDDNETNK